MPKILIGKIIEIGKMAKTIKVEVKTQRTHPLYKKVIKRSKNYLVDLNGLEPAVGQTVRIQETRPLSKNKRFKLLGDKKDAPKGATFAKAK